jgi:hypothetical protein
MAAMQIDQAVMAEATKRSLRSTANAGHHGAGAQHFSPGERGSTPSVPNPPCSGAASSSAALVMRYFVRQHERVTTTMLLKTAGTKVEAGLRRRSWRK